MNTQEDLLMRQEAALFVTHLAYRHHLDVLLVGGAVMFSEDHTVGRPAETRTET